MQFPKTTHKPVSNKLRQFIQVAVIGLTSIVFVSACQSSNGMFSKFEDGSLEYQKAKHLKPLKLPANQQTAPFVPLYPIVDAGPNTLDIKNKSGKRYKLPPPHRQVLSGGSY